uniref:2-dehydropantoate 2-reductase n=1 Tax=Rhizochromulina marina TaxID=1034831 RepID=A0A7S2RL10_9STRA|mmetsp:Transcript_17870/g.52188  ORF Transcript_17870/g.52188 Transcript_17870/m.52188 type:complete len:374 (+) Transcript_17870:197-1318(+)|eukprot:CAMPEP_0118962562 /NCGR_PEP_ID=MMETSP1173-20130426/856_1 /TAXON_ID=1034831 /ORGANISM="Rhizochromulina marina cf, Strain CCMP1243" /LENGTH=373 /DNA_ID=CAMNT_0006910841 /DNA_START=190 /DNA_END=1311 /DNA_ORIENTATION=+
MRVAVVGVGGVGGILAAALESAGQASVTLVSQGSGLAALRRHGLTVRTLEGRLHHFAIPQERLLSVDEAAASGEAHDVVFVTTKAQKMTSALDSLARLVGPSTLVVPCMNGLPWWFFHAAAAPGGKHTGLRLWSTDPTGRLSREISFPKVLGCVGSIAGQVHKNQASWHCQWPSEKNRLVLGDPAHPGNGPSDRVKTVAGLFQDAEIPVTVTHDADIRSKIFDHLLIHSSINAIAALSRGDCGQVVDDHSGEELLRDVVEEATAVANALDPPLRLSLNADDIIDMYRGQYGLRPSMLQDADSGRSIEKDSVVGALVELASQVGVETPSLKVILHLLDVMDSAASQRAGFGAFYDLSSADLPDRIRNMNYEIAP